MEKERKSLTQIIWSGFFVQIRPRVWKRNENVNNQAPDTHGFHESEAGLFCSAVRFTATFWRHLVQIEGAKRNKL